MASKGKRKDPNARQARAAIQVIIDYLETGTDIA